MENGHCVRTVHAEANAVAQAAKNGVNLSNSEVFITTSPCWTCFKLLANSGVVKISYSEFYQDKKIFDAAKLAGIELEHIPMESE